MKWVIRPAGWREFLVPPRDWLVSPKPIWENNPFAHITGGVVIGVWISLLSLPFVLAFRQLGLVIPWWLIRPGVVVYEGAKREEWQVEYWSEHGGYPACFAWWDTLSYLLGALLIEGAWAVFL